MFLERYIAVVETHRAFYNKLFPVQKKDTRLRENITDIAPKSLYKNIFLFILNLEYGYHTCMLFTLFR